MQKCKNIVDLCKIKYLYNKVFMSGRELSSGAILVMRDALVDRLKTQAYSGKSGVKIHLLKKVNDLLPHPSFSSSSSHFAKKLFITVLRTKYDFTLAEPCIQSFEGKVNSSFDVNSPLLFKRPLVHQDTLDASNMFNMIM